jgi:hypothetical protein
MFRFFQLFSFLPLFWLGLVIGVFFHEAGHAACALLCRIPVCRVSIGVGRVVFRRHLGATAFELRLLPVAGYVAIRPYQVRWKFQLLLFTLGGILGNIAVIALIARLPAPPAIPQPAFDSLGPIAWAQLALIVGSFIPMNIGGGRNDGKLFLFILRLRRKRA